MMTALVFNLSVTVAMLLGFCCTFPKTVSATVNKTLTEGEDFMMKCSMKGNFDGVYVYGKLPNSQELLYYDRATGTETIHTNYKQRVSTKTEAETLTVSISNLQQSDSGVYYCKYVIFGGPSPREENNILMIVKGIEPKHVKAPMRKDPTDSTTPEPLVLVSILSACAVVMLICLVTVLWVIPKTVGAQDSFSTVERVVEKNPRLTMKLEEVKILCKKQQEEVSKGGVYEEMHGHRRQYSSSRI